MDNNEVILAYISGKKLIEIAIEKGVSKQRIDQILKKANVARHERCKITDDVKATVKAMVEDYKDYATITAVTGVSGRMIYGILKEVGFDRSSLGYRCRTCGSTEWRANGKGKICKSCSAKRAREYYKTHGKGKKVTE